jgi:nicotinate-nucleotide pyrophosphorylase (carboxylating)
VTIDIHRFIAPGDLNRLILTARREDLGPRGRDITSRLLIPADARATAELRSRAAGRWCGTPLLQPIAHAFDRDIRVEPLLDDGAILEPGAVVARFSGPLRAVLAMERVTLNFVTHLSGIATLTARYVAAIAGTHAAIYDTRKTLPGLRGLEKYAVVCGGGVSHRFGLHDAILAKDNHLAAWAPGDLPAAITMAIIKARHLKPAPTFIEVEVDTLDQLAMVLAIEEPGRPDMVLLDNMTPQQLTAAVALRARVAPRVALEASGGVNLQTVAAIAASGVDRISVGALTHSAPALDLGLDIA